METKCPKCGALLAGQASRGMYSAWPETKFCEKCVRFVTVEKEHDRDSGLIDIIQGLLRALEACQEMGCIDHIDCWDEREALWYAPMDRAKAAVAAYEKMVQHDIHCPARWYAPCGCKNPAGSAAWSARLPWKQEVV